MASPKKIVIVALPGVQLLDVAGPLEVFDGARRIREHRGAPPGYMTIVAGPTRRVATSTGLEIECRPLDALPRGIDTVIIAGALEFATKSWTKAELAPLARLVRRARRVASVCAGAFVLQALGLLAGRRATTHWLCLDALAARAPDAEIERDAIYVRDGHVYTSAGVTSGIDLALAMVEEDFGYDLAVAVARVLVVYLHRPGGQSQFSAALTRRRPSPGPIARLQAAIVDDPAGDHRVETLAARARMSARNFARVFVEETGVTPAKYVRDVRVEAARQLLERGADDVVAVAAAVGLGTSESLRRAFVAKLGVPPSAYRERFRTAKSRRRSGG